MDRKQQALEVIAKVSGKEAQSLKPDMDLVADVGIDSPKALQLIVELEDNLGIEISDEEAARMEKVSDILACAEKQPA